jgi:transposase
MSRSQTQRPRDAARLTARHAAAATTSTPAGLPAPNQDDRQPKQLVTASAEPLVAIGVGFDTSRYGHYAAFLRADLQPAAGDLMVLESGAGYQELRQRLDAIAAKHAGQVHFHMRLDVAGCYADNLLAFLHALPYSKTISCGDPQRNKNYRVAIFGSKKSDPVEAHACARFALSEKPQASARLTPAMRVLGQIASRLESQARHVTRVRNQLHNLLARTFPEFAVLVKDLSAGWVLQVLNRYPTAAQLAKARPSALEKIPYLPHEHIPALVQQACTSVASLSGPAVQTLVRDLVGQLKDAQLRQHALEKVLVESYRQLPANHLDTIPGIGAVTAAILTAKIVDPHRFVVPTKLTAYFGVFPVQAASGIDREGKARPPVRMIMCRRGNDLVRRYLWMASLSAAQHNSATRPLFQRVRAKHPDQPSIALGHVMAKLLRIALAVWKTGKPFDPEHYPWEKPAHLEPQAPPQPEGKTDAAEEPSAVLQENPQAAGHKNPDMPVRSVVTAACSISSVTQLPADGNHPTDSQATHLPGHARDISSPVVPSRWLDFAQVKSQLPMRQVLEHLNLFAQLRSSGSQWRGPCPVHGQGKGRTFSVHLEKNVFQCFDAKCAIKGDVIDLWAAIKGLKLRDAALELVAAFNLKPAP